MDYASLASFDTFYSHESVLMTGYMGLTVLFDFGEKETLNKLVYMGTYNERSVAFHPAYVRCLLVKAYETTGHVPLC